MDCSTKKSSFAGDFSLPWFYQSSNGSTLYCNGSYTMNWVCNSTIKADTDIAGPGIIASFILVSWITLFVALIPAYYDLLEFLNRAQEWNWHSLTMIHEKRRSTEHLRRTNRLRSTLRSDRTALLRKTAFNMLGSLCDLQIVTGLAIVIAGLAQIPAITFYHESLAMSYWWLTLNSFWAARVDYMDENSNKYAGRATIRRIGVLVSVVLGMAFQCIINVRENREWFFLRSGYCYLYHNNSSSWPWVVGTSIYAVSLSLSIVPATRPWVDSYRSMLRCMQERLIKRWNKSSIALQKSYSHPVNGYDLSFVRTFLCIAYRMTIFGSISLCLALFWLLRQFFAAWSSGGGFYPLLIFVYFAFGAWNTYDILDLKLSNRSLIDGQESGWGFGQILPMVLLLTIGFNAVDAFRGKDICPEVLGYHMLMRLCLFNSRSAY